MEPWNVENSSSPASGSQLYTSHFPVQMNEELLRSLFERFGPLREVACKFASTSATWGPSHAFVTYEKPEDAQAAIAAMDGLKGNEMLRSILEKRDQKFSWRDEVLEVKPRTFVGSRSRSDGAGSRRGPPASGSRNGGSSRPEPSRYRSADNGFDPSRSPVRRRSPPGGFRSPPREREPRSPPPRDREYRSPPLEDRGAYSSPRERDARERDRFHRELPSREPPSRHDDRAHDSYSRSPPPSNDRDRRGYSPPARAMRRSRSRSPTQMRRPPSGDYQRSSRD